MDTVVAHQKCSITYLLRWGGSATTMGKSHTKIIQTKKIEPRHSGDQKSHAGITIFNYKNNSNNQIKHFTNGNRNKNGGLRSTEALSKRKHTRSIKRYIARNLNRHPSSDKYKYLKAQRAQELAYCNSKLKLAYSI